MSMQAVALPLAISERGYLEIKARFASRLRPDALLASPGKPLDGAPNVCVRDGVAVIDVCGPLAKDPDLFYSLFGIETPSYSGILRAFTLALNDPSVRAIVLNIDSPGGSVYGCAELAQAIYAARSVKPVYAYAGGQCDSAAYWIASACDEVIANEAGELGSIGVRTMMIDDSKALETMGVTVYDIVADQSPLKVADAASPEDRARVKALMTDYATVFIANVAEYRDVGVETVMSEFGRGDVMVGQSAVDAGLADRLGTLEGVIAELSAATNQENVMKVNQNSAAAAPVTPAASKASGKCSGCKADMGDDDDMYCAGCSKGSKASAFAASVMAILGESDESKAIGALTGFKAQAAKVDDLEAQLAAARKQVADAEVKGILDSACLDGRVKPAQRGQFEQLYAEHGLGALNASLSVLTPAPAPAVPASEEAAAKSHAENAPKAPAAAAAVALPPDQMKMLAKLGMTAEQYAEHRRKYLATVNPSEEK